MRVYESRNREETFELGVKLGEKAKPGDIYAVTGDLGAGKTVLAKGLAKGLGFEGVVNSPTFTVMQEYRGGRLDLFHFDTYRIEEPEEMYELDYEEYFFGKGVCLIEWPGQIEELIPENAVKINMEYDRPDDIEHRRITIEG
ncbi:MAG: tRNA (adenosine(37)-N6)-threonylcarbamoyltransferase complex ATPase subunit type 1 TsaE [Lachnospiraceae bacterium]|nr:tRNA (adenosine(37)-N6)-threonylcarbamoyltransferase complex ATPase subunit type 1 TsaE [Lachnospiraceae bacterium]